MVDIVPFAYAPGGQLYVVADGPELMVHSGANDQGLWHHVADDIWMGVGATAAHVFAVNGAGTLVTYRAIDGLEQSRLDLSCSAWGLVVSAEGHCAIWSASRAVIVRFGEGPVEVAVEGPRTACWAGERVLFGGSDGGLTLVDASTGEVVHQIHVMGSIRSIARLRDGWLAATTFGLIAVKDDLTDERPVPVEMAPRRIAVSEDGSVLAAQLDDDRVVISAVDTGTSLGEVTFERTLSGLAFGPGGWLAFGFDDGDANRLDVLTGKITRTQAHLGRAQNAWPVHVRIQYALVRGVMVTKAAGEAPIAQQIRPKGTFAKRPWLGWVIGCGVFALLSVLCCGGIGAAVWWWR
jgi:hypothetical protein